MSLTTQTDANTIRDTAVLSPKLAGAAKDLEIMSLLAQLYDETLMLQDEFSILNDRLAPIKRNEPTNQDVPDSPLPQTAIGDSLTTILSRVKSVTTSIRSARGQLEL